MESSHGQLSPWFTNGLSSHNSYRSAKFDRSVETKIVSVTFDANTTSECATQNGADFYIRSSRFVDFLGELVIYVGTGFGNYLSVLVFDFGSQNSAKNPASQGS